MKSCQNTSRLLASTFLKEKTGDCWILGILRLQRILLPKNAIFHSLKSAHFVKNFATNPEFCQFMMYHFSLFIKFRPKKQYLRHDGQFSSF